MFSSKKIKRFKKPGAHAGNNSLFFKPAEQMKSPAAGDDHEQQAINMASAITNDQPASIHAKCNCGKEEQLQLKPSDATVPDSISIVQDVVGTSGQKMDEPTKTFMESKFGYDFGDVEIHNDSQANESSSQLNALAYTHGGHIVFGKGQYQPHTHTGKQLLAHELTHVIQQSNSGTDPVIQRDPDPKRQQTPQDRQAVALAKARLAKLEPLLNQAEAGSLSIEADKLRTLSDRKRLDDNAADLAMPAKRQLEEEHLAKLNRLPINIIQSGTDIVFEVKFQVFFEDPSMKSRFDDVKNNVMAGIKMVWDQTIATGVFSGRKFSIKPTFTLIDDRSARDHNFWLINVRTTNKGKVAYPGCKLDEPGPDFPTSVTDPMCDGGVMSIPPLHITMPDVLGHEMLHLFGLVDRYFTTISEVEVMVGKKKTKKKVLESEQTRETFGRKDPLGGEAATIFREDLGYLFDKFGVYKQEDVHNQAIIQFARPEVARLKRIVELGYDPDSLLPIRQNFDDKMIKDAEDL